jgi:hypothetical protein
MDIVKPDLKIQLIIVCVLYLLMSSCSILVPKVTTSSHLILAIAFLGLRQEIAGVYVLLAGMRHNKHE